MSNFQMSRKDSSLRRFVRILAGDSVRDLVRYKSFLLLIFLLIIVDHLLHRFVVVDKSDFHMPDIRAMGLQAAGVVFEELPALVLDWVLDVRTLGVVAGLFLAKQIISLWPSSDMRRMHRNERKGAGIIGSLLSIRAMQAVWDAAALGIVCTIGGIWIGMFFGVFYGVWKMTGSVATLVGFVAFTGVLMPLMMAGFSFSSKFAVISTGGFGEKLRRFVYIFTRPRIIFAAWIFFGARILVEAIFVAVIPAGAMMMISNYMVRIGVAALSAAPVYAFLKMASFKFFLWIYRNDDIVRNEYHLYYTA